ncbi:protein GOLM2-like isoform X2 [Saccostrea echinata]|uniref:protein GOLM2-like isoform X2 n=1 Tax=Saccostrea echinata TaxID=191078 RepID=UPI002A81688C|nr:protein GOLM2-like isoform X2 [Saccostrea echinata]
MAANGRGTMRPQSRSPPFLITGLVVALVILGANYWNLSSSNASLSAEVADLQDQIRILSSKKINSERKNENAMLRIRDFEKNINSKEQELTKLKTDLGELGASKDACTAKLKQNEDNMSGIQQELATYKDKVQKYESQKSSTVTEQKQDCSLVCTEKRKELFAQMEKLGYYQALQGLSQSGVDIMEFKDKIGSLQGREAGQSQSGQQQQQQILQSGASQLNKQPQVGGLQDISPTTQPSRKQTSTKKPRKPATGSIMNVKFGDGSRKSVNQTASQKINKNMDTLKGNTTLRPKESLSGEGRAQSQNNTATRKDVAKTQGAQLPAPGLIMYNSRNNSIVGDGILKVLPSSKVRLMKGGENIVEMQQKNKRLDAKKLDSAKTEYGKSDDKKYDIGEEDEYIDDKASEKNPNTKLQNPNKAGEKQKKTNQFSARGGITGSRSRL